SSTPLERRGRLALDSELFAEFPIGAAQFGFSPSDDGPRFVYCLHRFFVTVRQNPERSCAQRLLQLRKADVKTPSLVMAVHNQLHGFVTVPRAGKRAQVMLRVAHGRELLSQHDKNRIRKFQAAEQEWVQGARTVDNDDVVAFDQEGADFAQMLFSDVLRSFEFCRCAQDRETQRIARNNPIEHRLVQLIQTVGDIGKRVLMKTRELTAYVTG